MRITILLFITWLVFCDAKGQDIQFSQFYAAPLYLNPAFSGSTQQTRFGLNYRNQWPSVQANFVSYSVYADHYLPDYSSGIGLILTADQPGDFRFYDIGLQYAYQLPVSESLTIRAGTQVSYTFMNFVPGGELNFLDEYQPGVGFTPGAGSADEIGLGDNNRYFDLGFGGLVYSANLFFGVSAFHILRPDRSLYEGSNDRLPIKYSIHGGYRFDLTDESRPFNRSVYLTPTAQYKRQGVFDQLDAGLYLTLEPMVFGVWYRGIPVPQFDATPHESIIALIGFSQNGFNFGYSFDYTVSDLGINAGGAHEVSLSYEMFIGDPRKPPKHVRQIPCPKF